MKTVIDTTGQEQEGLMYDLEKANNLGLMEETRLYQVAGVYGDPVGTQLIEIELDDEKLKALQLLIPDIAANIYTGTPVQIDLKLKYVYGYGKPE